MQRTEVDHKLGYWDEIAGVWRANQPHVLWRAHSDAVNRALVDRWLPSGPLQRILKTDLFDEAVGSGLFELLKSKSRHVIGIDLSVSAASAARSKNSALSAICADVRGLPFADETFDAVVSNSTLDHFDAADQITASLRELRRVLKPGGELILTMDNLANPLVALRNLLPFSLLERIGIVPYYVGITCGPRRLSSMVGEVGFEVVEVEGIMHAPRALAVAAAGFAGHHVSAARQRQFLRLLRFCERLGGWPTRFLTGYYVAIKAKKPRGPAA